MGLLNIGSFANSLASSRPVSRHTYHHGSQRAAATRTYRRYSRPQIARGALGSTTASAQSAAHRYFSHAAWKTHRDAVVAAHKRSRSLSRSKVIASLLQGGLSSSHPLFTAEGPQFYGMAIGNNRRYALPGPYQTKLPSTAEKSFRDWVHKYHVPFNPNAKRADYDMRGYFRATRGKPYRGGHFPDTFKTPYDTTFSSESKYSTSDNPFVWRGNRLVNKRTGQVVFAPARVRRQS